MRLGLRDFYLNTYPGEAGGKDAAKLSRKMWQGVIQTLQQSWTPFYVTATTCKEETRLHLYSHYHTDFISPDPAFMLSFPNLSFSKPRQ